MINDVLFLIQESLGRFHNSSNVAEYSHANLYFARHNIDMFHVNKTFKPMMGLDCRQHKTNKSLQLTSLELYHGQSHYSVNITEILHEGCSSWIKSLGIWYDLKELEYTAVFIMQFDISVQSNWAPSDQKNTTAATWLYLHSCMQILIIKIWSWHVSWQWHIQSHGRAL